MAADMIPVDRRRSAQQLKGIGKEAVSRKIHIEAYGMTNSQRCVILPAGSRRALCGPAGFAIMRFQFNI
ncbi:hypothetical protein BCAR13_1040027 [Paraburkholderia caribensis]|nr:hypothetical protein BCAR13_1040027 [Paraburkholderia caribensis]